MYENKTDDIPVKAVLACVDTGEFDAEVSIAELEELATTANADVVGSIIQKRPAYDSATCMGAGRLEELKEQLEALGAELVIFDHELTGVQVRNIEEILDVRVIDRTTLILDIFAQRARTKEGKLQVELAQQKYRLPRLTGMGTALSRLGGGIGTRGPGETKLETDKRHIRKRISYLEAELEELKKHKFYEDAPGLYKRWQVHTAERSHRRRSSRGEQALCNTGYHLPFDRAPRRQKRHAHRYGRTYQETSP